MVNCRFRIKKDSDVIKALIGDDNVSYDVTKHRPKSIMIRSKEDVWSTDLENKIIYAGYNQVADSTTLVLERWTVFGLRSVEGKQAWFKVGVGTLDQVEEPTDYITAINKIIILRDPVIDGRYGLTEASSKSPNEGIDEMDTIEAQVEVCGGGEQFKDKVKAVELPTTDWYEVEAYVHFPGVDRVSARLHNWFAKKMMAETPGIFTYRGRGSYEYQLVELDEEGSGKVRTNEPNVTKVTMAITLNERTVIYRTEMNFVTSDYWQIRGHMYYGETEEQRQAKLDADEKRKQYEAERDQAELTEKQAIAQNTPKVFEGQIVEWEMLVTNKDIPVEKKIETITKVLDSEHELFGWWDGEEKFQQYHKDLRTIGLPDYRVMSIDPDNQKVSIQELTPPPEGIRDTHMVAFAYIYNKGTMFEDREISGVIGSHLIDRTPFIEAQKLYDEQQAVLKSIRGE